MVEEISGKLYFAHYRNRNVGREGCSGFDLCEDQKCASNCVRCEGILMVRPFVCAYLGSHGHDSGKRVYNSVRIHYSRN